MSKCKSNFAGACCNRYNGHKGLHRSKTHDAEWGWAIIHKSIRSPYSSKKQTKCGKVIKIGRTSYHWKNVTCKNCIWYRKDEVSEHGD